MKNNGLSLITASYDILNGRDVKALALDGKEIPGQTGIKGVVCDRRGFRIVTATFTVPDKPPLAERDPTEVYMEYEFSKIKERVFKLYNRAMFGSLIGFEEVANAIGGMHVVFSIHGIQRIKLMEDIASFAFRDYPLIRWTVTKHIDETHPTLEFMGVEKR